MNSIVRNGVFSKSERPKSVDELLREHASGLSYRALEQRIAFDGAAVATAVAADQPNHQDAGPADNGASAQHHAPSDSHELAAAMADGPAPAGNSPASVVFIDSAVKNASEHLAGIDPSAEVVVLDSGHGGLEQIASYVAGRTDIGSIHIISHGDAGSLILGNSIVTGNNLQAYASELAAIGNALSADGDILIYGCAFGAGDIGREAADLFAALTHADVAASTDATGSAVRGGDFDLEYATGSIESRLAISTDAQSTYDDLLAVTVNNGNGALVINVGNTLYTVDTTTGKATAITTIPATVGGIAFTGPANSLAIDQTNGLIYYTDNTSANANRALFAYDFINDQHILIDSDLTNNGAGASITVGTTGLGSGSATFHNGVLYLGVENVTGSDDRIYAITFTGAGRTVATAATFGPLITGTNDWGDLTIDVANNALVSISQATGITRYNLSTGALLGNVAYAVTGPQAATDASGNVYIVNTSIQQVNPTTGANVGAAIAITTNGTTAITAPPDAASWVPATGTIGDKIFDDNNVDGAFNGGDAGIANVTVQLIDDVNNNGVADVGERVLATDTTDASGNYLFSGVLPGRYVIRVTDTNSVLGALPSTTGGATQTATINKIGGNHLTADFGYDARPPVVDLNSAPASSTTTNTSSATSTSNLVTNGTFATAGNPPAGWTEAGTDDGDVAGGRYIWVDGPGTLAQNLAVPADASNTTKTTSSTATSTTVTTTTVATTDAITSIAFDMAYQNADTFGADDNRLIISYNGVVYATFETSETNGAADAGTWTYSNGASGPASVAGVGNEQTDTLTAITINLPAGIIASGQLLFSWGNGSTGDGSDDIAIDNVVVTSAKTTTTTIVTTTEDTADNNWTTTFTENGPAVSIADIDSSIFDADSANMTSAAITLTNPAAGDRLLVNGSSAASGTLGSGIAWTRTDTAVTLSGSFTKAQYADAIELIQFENTSETPSNTPRTINVTVRDGISTSNTAVATINVDRVPDPVNDTASGNEDTAISGNVLTNDDVGDTPITSVTVATGPANGTLTSFNTTTGAFIYTPNANFNGSDTFTYTVTDADGDARTATVTITVNPVADAPTQTVPGAQATAEDTVRVIAGTSVADVDGGALTTTLTLPAGAGSISVVTGGGAVITNNGTGTVTIAGTAAQINAAIASITYAPAADYNGSTSLSVSTTDGTATASNSIAITVTAVADIANDAVTTNEDTAATFNVLTNDTFENPGRAVTSVTQGANGTVTFLANGAVTYTPNANFNGTDTFTYTVTSGGVTETATVTVTVNPVNDPPTQTVPGAQTTAEDTVRVITGTSVADVDGGALTTTLTLPAGAGTISVVTGGGAVITNNGTGTVTIAGTAAQINAAIASITYAPTADYNGSTSLSVSTTDGSLTASNAVAITVTAVADITNDTITTAENAAATFNVITGTNGATADTFENPGRAVTSVTQGANGTVTFTAAGVLTYTPNASYNGTDTFTYTVTSGGVTETATVTVTVTPVNDPPTQTVPGAQATAEDTVRVIAGTSVADVDGGALTTTLTLPAGAGTISVVTGGGAVITNNGTGTVTIAGTAAQINAAIASITYAPAADYNGSTSLSVSTTDGTATASNSIAITVTAVADIANDAVTTNEDTAATFNVLTNDTFENPGRAVTSVTQGANGTVTFLANGSVTYTPNANFNGTDTFTYTVTSGGVTETATVTVTVNPVNDPPTQTVPGAQTTAEDTVRVITGTSVADVDGGALTTTLTLPAGAGTISVVTGGGAVITNNGTGTVTIAGTAAQINAAIASITYAPAADYNGSTSLSVSTTDGTATASNSIAITVTAVADIANDAVTTNEDTAATFNVLTNDTFENPGRAVTSVTQGANGTVTFLANGAVTYTPNANFNGTDTFTYTVTSGGVTETATVTVTVNPVNDPPTQTVPGAQTTAEDTVRVITGTSVADVDGGALTTTLTLPAGAGTISVVTGGGAVITNNGTGTVTIAGTAAQINAAIASITYAPTADYNGSTSLSVSTTDGSLTASNAVAITVTAVADITNDTITTAENAAATFNVITGTNGATADTFENPGRAVTSVTQGANGTVTFTAAGVLTYTPNASYNGTDTFTYTVTSGGVTETATVTVTVNPVNDPPTQTVPGAQTTAEDTVRVITGTSVADVDGGALTTTLTLPAGAGTISVVTGGGAVITNNGTGTVTIAGTAAQINAAIASITYAPAADYNGSTSLSVSTTDGTATASNSIAITVTAVADIANDAVTTNEDTAATFNVLTNDTFENPGRAVTSVTQGANGTVTFLANGAVTYTPNANFNGTDTFTYTVTSGGVTETATVTVTVNPVNDPPTQTVPGAQTTAEDTVRVITGTSVADVDGGALTTTLTLPAGAGTISVVTGGGAVITNNGTGTVTIAGTAAQINAAIASITYAPTADYNGSTSLSVSTTDGSLTASNAVAITVTAVADITNDTITTAENAAATFNVITGTNGATADTFENPGRAVTSVTQGANGTVTFTAAGVLTYTPNASYNGTDTFTYTVTSGGVTETATVTVTVTPVNDPPTQTVPGAQATAEDTVRVIAGTSVADVDGGALTTTLTLPAGAGSISVVTGGGAVITNNGTGTVTIAGTAAQINAAIASITYAPAADYNGSTSLSVSTTDGTATASNSIAITVTAVADIANDAVTTNEDTAATFNVLTNDTFENPGRAVTSVTQGANGTVTFLANGSVTYTPNANFNGTDTFTYTVTSGGVTETATVTVTVNPVNDPPVATGDSFTTLEDTPVSGTLPIATDADGDALTYSLATPAANGAVVVNPDGTYTYTPVLNYNGPDSFTYTVSDGNGGTATQTVSITVAPVNDAPAVAGTSITTVEDTPVSGTLPVATDVDGDALTYSLAAPAASGTAVVNADGTYTYTPDASFAGSDSFAFTVSDGNGGMTTRTVVISVTPISDAPTISTITAAPSKDGDRVTFNASAFVTETDGDPLTYAATGLPPGLSIDPATGRITGVLPPNASSGGPYAVTLTVDDGAGNVVSTTFAWKVDNPAPIARNDAATGRINEAVSIAVLTNDSDPDGDSPLTVTAASAARGSVEILADGSIRYTPPANFAGRDSISYVVSDGNGGFSTATVTINVADSGYDEKPTVFGFDGGDALHNTNDNDLPTYESISVDGAVVDAVFDINSLNSFAGQLSGDGIVIAAANGVAPLNGVGGVGANGIVLDTIRAERARDIAMRAGFDRTFQEYRIEGLPGFSLRNDVLGNLGGLSAREQIVIESLVRDQTLLLQISNTLERGARRIVEYRITQLDGSALPSWLNRAASDLLIGRRDVNVESISLRIEAVYSDGASVIEEIKVDTATGEIQPIKSVRQGELAPPLLFKDQFRAKPILSGDQVRDLGRALAR